MKIGSAYVDNYKILELGKAQKRHFSADAPKNLRHFWSGFAH
ncbi:hypothetical protein [Aureibaculum algae]|nr:hypothetical protein [Aureibaculum algae]